MKKIVFFALAIFIASGLYAQVNLKIGSGSYLLARGTAQLVIDTGSIVNNGAYIDSTGTLVAAGGITISGSGLTRLNDFMVSNTQHSLMNSLVSVYKTANLFSGFLDANNNLYIRSDVSSAANMVVSGVLSNNVKGITASASATSGACPSYTSALSLNISGPVVKCQWQSSTDSAAWTSVSGATNATYTATVTATVYYRCNLTTTNSAFTESTPGVKLLYGPLPIAGSISGPSAVTVGSNISLTDAAGGGTWSASNGDATVSSGVVHGVSAGTVTISYAVTNSCGNASATKLVTVGTSTTTATVSAISGYYFYLCAGANATFWDATTGGTWSMTPAGVATVSATGIVTGITAGTAVLSYTYSGTLVTAVVTVNASPAVIAGASSLCIGTTTALTDATAGGTWSSTSGTVASISTAGVVTGGVAGTTTIYYITPTNGCKAALVVTVTAGPSGIGGATWVCIGSSISLSDYVGGGTWSSTALVSIVATGGSSATVTGLSAGTATITYALASSCYRTYNVTVKGIPTPILGNLAVCGVGSVTFLSDITAGTSWTISPVGTATISPSGRVYGVSAGTAAVTYNAATGCFITATVTINAGVAVSPISGAANVGHGLTISLSDVTGGGVWSSSNAALGSVDAAGNVTGVGTSGTITISYLVSYAGGGCTATATKAITVHSPTPHGHGSSASTGIGESVSIAEEISGGEWTSSDNGIATIDGNGVATGIASGIVNISHTVTNADGTVSTTVTRLVVNPLSIEVTLQPNPNRGAFTIIGTISSDRANRLIFEITNMLGQVVYSSEVAITGGIINEQIKLNGNIANGTYLLNVHSINEQKVFHFVVDR